MKRRYDLEHKMDNRPGLDEIGAQLRRKLRWVVSIAVGSAALALALMTYDRVAQPAPDRRIAIYFTHGCSCVFGWARSLRDAGYAVDLFEPESLALTRKQLQVPPHLRGCHLAEYLGYFLDGHIPAESLPRLATEHPSALGLAPREITEVAPDPQDGVLLVRAQGPDEPWPADPNVH